MAHKLVWAKYKWELTISSEPIKTDYGVTLNKIESPITKSLGFF